MTMRTLVLTGLLASVSVAATAEPLPNWKIGDICAQESAPGQCATFEGEALRALSGSWPFVLEPVKQACIAQSTLPVDRSYRLLAECIDNGTLSVLESQAVKTAATPAEPVPLPKPLGTDTTSQSNTPQAQQDTNSTEGQKAEPAASAPAQPKQ